MTLKQVDIEPTTTNELVIITVTDLYPLTCKPHIHSNVLRANQQNPAEREAEVFEAERN